MFPPSFDSKFSIYFPYIIYIITHYFFQRFSPFFSKKKHPILGQFANGTGSLLLAFGTGFLLLALGTGFQIVHKKNAPKSTKWDVFFFHFFSNFNFTLIFHAMNISKHSYTIFYLLLKIWFST